eukprot:7061116-Prymnesium_polylepis.1
METGGLHALCGSHSSQLQIPSQSHGRRPGFRRAFSFTQREHKSRPPELHLQLEAAPGHQLAAAAPLSAANSRWKRGVYAVDTA